MRNSTNLCPFCRAEPVAASNEESKERLQKRVDAGNTEAIQNQGHYYQYGTNGFPQDYDKALELLLRAGQLGCATNGSGRGVEQDEKKAVYYYELAAMKGDVNARYNLGVFEQVRQLYSGGYVTKYDYTKALRVYQSYIDSVKSIQRDEAAAANKKYKYYTSLLIEP